MDRIRLNIHELTTLFSENDLSNILNNRTITAEQFSLYMQQLELEAALNVITDEEDTKYKRVLKPDEMDKIKKVKYDGFARQKEHINPFCSILQDDFDENEIILRLPCKHYFNYDSIIRWFQTESHICPVCRFNLDYREVSKAELDTLKDLDATKLTWLYKEQDPALTQLSQSSHFRPSKKINMNDISNANNLSRNETLINITKYPVNNSNIIAHRNMMMRNRNVNRQPTRMTRMSLLF